MRKLFFAAALILAFLSGLTAHAQICQDSFFQKPQSADQWIDAIRKISQIDIDIESEKIQKAPAFLDLQKYLGQLANEKKNLSEAKIDKLVAKLYLVANDPLNETTALSELGLENSIAEGLHEKLFTQIMKTDLTTALRSYGLVSFKNKGRIREYLKRYSTKIQLGFWAAIHAPLLIFSGQVIPIYLPAIKELRVTPQMEALVRQNLEAGDFNAALRVVEPSLRETYGTTENFRHYYGITYRLFNSFSVLVMAHSLLLNPVMSQYFPEVSQSYQETIIPVVHKFERAFSDRSNLEVLVTKEVVGEKEKILGHKIIFGSPEYEATAQNVRRLNLNQIRMLRSSFEHR